MLNRPSRLVLAGLLLSLGAFAAPVQDDVSALARGFQDPPARARPDAFWTWLNGHADPARITMEMEAFKAAGFSRLQVWDVRAHRDPDHIVPVGPSFLGDEWLKNLAHANREAQRIGLELGLVAASGWNAGGPWVTSPRAGLRIYCSTQTVRGGAPANLKLEFPEVSEYAPRVDDNRPAYWETISVQAVPAAADGGMDVHQVIDLTDKANQLGQLTCVLPRGDWEIRWFIYSNSGQLLTIPSPSSGGLQIDFFDEGDSRWYFHYVCDLLESALGPLEESALAYLEVDSLELEGGRLSAWTEEAPARFMDRYGYDPKPYLTLLLEEERAPKTSGGDAFLRDWARLISDLMIENHYRVGTEVLAERGLQLSAEAGGPGPPIWNSCPVDAIGALGATELVRGEFWPKQRSMFNVKGIASAAHVYGKPIVDAESFTSWRHWRDLPYYLKLLADQAFYDGLNHITFHTAPHGGSENGLPGYAYHAGTHIGPNLVWWPMAKPFIDYLCRCSFLLQEGTPVADVCFYQGASAPVFHPLGVDWDPAVRPLGYDYDVIDKRQLLDAMTWSDGRLRLPNGVSYRMLVLPDDQPLLPEIAAKVKGLADEGAVIVGPGFREQPLKKILQEAAPDFTWEDGDERTRLGFVHRQGPGWHSYFVLNHNERWESVRGVFRTERMRPEIWDPSSGSMEPAQWEVAKDGRTKVGLTLAPGGSCFVVFEESREEPTGIRLVDLERGVGVGVDAAHGDAPGGAAWTSSGAKAPASDSIVYDLGRATPVAAADIWNYQDQARGLLTRGIKRFEITVSLDGEDFQSAGEFTLGPAPNIGERGHQERIEWPVEEARFVRLSVLENHSSDWSGRTNVVGINRIAFIGADGKTIDGVRVARHSSGVAFDPASHDERAGHRSGPELKGPWRVTFPTAGEAEALSLEKLRSWTTLGDFDLKHFSGVASYEIEFEGADAQRALELDLGRVAGIAQVSLNGVDLGIAWHPPYAVNVADALQPGTNLLRVDVANTWHNRLVGDAALAPDARTTVTNIRGPFTPETELLEAGLLGPVRWIQSGAPLPRPTEAQLRWQEAELGVVFHYDLHVCGEGRHVQSENRVRPIEDLDRFRPDELDTDQWVRAAKAAGARFAILTGSHETGFRLWQSKVNPYCLSAVQWGDGKRDIVEEFHASCLKHGIKPGIYLGTRWNSQLGIFDFKVTERSTITQEEYNHLIEAEVLEICTGYGDWFEFWFDGGAHGPDQGGPDVLSIVEKHQPNAVFYHNLQRADARWGGSESGTVAYPCWSTFPFPVTGSGESARPEISANGFALLRSGDPDGQFWLPAMSDAPLRGFGGHEWFWEPDQEHLIYPLEKLVDMYCRSVGRNSTLILGLTPDDRGLLPDADVQRLAEFGDAVHLMLGEPQAQAKGSQSLEGVSLEPSEPFDLVTLQEDVRHGERLRRYRVEARTNGAWQTVAKGSCIGHKRIHRLSEPVFADRIRLVVEEATSTVRMRNLAVGLDRRRAR